MNKSLPTLNVWSSFDLAFNLLMWQRCMLNLFVSFLWNIWWNSPTQSYVFLFSHAHLSSASTIRLWKLNVYDSHLTASISFSFNNHLLSLSHFFPHCIPTFCNILQHSFEFCKLTVECLALSIICLLKASATSLILEHLCKLWQYACITLYAHRHGAVKH